MTQPPVHPLEYRSPNAVAHQRAWFAPLTFAGLGGLAGLLLLAISCFAVGPHGGTLLMRDVASSPLVLLDSGALPVYGMPFLWAALGTLLGASLRSPVWRLVFVAAMLVHYAFVPEIMRGGWPSGSRAAVHLEAVTPGLVVYAGIQVAIWVVFTAALLSSLRPRPRV